MVPCWNFKKIL